MRLGMPTKRNDLNDRRTPEQRRDRILRFIAIHEAILTTQGAVTATWRQWRGRRLGPYFRLVYRNAVGRQQSIYLGADAGLAAEVQSSLRRLRACEAERRQVDTIRRAVRREIRQLRAALNKELSQLALRCQGGEIRGWSARRNRANATSPGEREECTA